MIIHISLEEYEDFMAEDPTQPWARPMMLVQAEVNCAETVAGKPSSLSAFSASLRAKGHLPNAEKPKRHWTEELSESLDRAPVVDRGPCWAGRVAR